eukprot:GHVU01191472.1.p1 GENE.GHVU01191472.1~~GHVU01191472.1.p1  ORF type:complete len:753 (+),score=100.24 GHVU01191472.1:199-2259(+)
MTADGEHEYLKLTGREFDDLPSDAIEVSADVVKNSDPKRYGYFYRGRAPDTRRTELQKTYHPPAELAAMPWVAICDADIAVPDDSTKRCVLNVDPNEAELERRLAELMKEDPRYTFSRPEIVETDEQKAERRYNHLQQGITRKLTGFNEHGEPQYVDVKSKWDEREDGDWDKNNIFFRGLGRDAQVRGGETAGPTHFQSPFDGEYDALDIESHLELRCPKEKRIFDEKFVVKVMLPGGNMRKCYVEFEWDDEQMYFLRRGLKRYYPFKYLKEANDSPNLLTHMRVTGAVPDLLDVDESKFCALYLSNVQHPLLLVFSNTQRRTFFARLVMHTISYCQVPEPFFFNVPRVSRTGRRNAVINIPTVQLFNTEIEAMGAGEIKASFENGVTCDCLTFRRLASGVMLRFDASNARLHLVSKAGTESKLPLDQITALLIDPDELASFSDLAGGVPSGPKRSPSREMSLGAGEGLTRSVSRVAPVQPKEDESFHKTIGQLLPGGPRCSKFVAIKLRGFDDTSDGKTPVIPPMIMIFGSTTERNDFVTFVLCLQEVLNFPLAETDQELKLRMEEEEWKKEMDDEVMGMTVEDKSLDKKATVRETDRQLAGEDGFNFRYFRAGRGKDKKESERQPASPTGQPSKEFGASTDFGEPETRRQTSRESPRQAPSKQVTYQDSMQRSRRQIASRSNRG